MNKLYLLMFKDGDDEVPFLITDDEIYAREIGIMLTTPEESFPSYTNFKIIAFVKSGDENINIFR